MSRGIHSLRQRRRDVLAYLFGRFIDQGALQNRASSCASSSTKGYSTESPCRVGPQKGVWVTEVPSQHSDMRPVARIAKSHKGVPSNKSHVSFRNVPVRGSDRQIIIGEGECVRWLEATVSHRCGRQRSITRRTGHKTFVASIDSSSHSNSKLLRNRAGSLEHCREAPTRIEDSRSDDCVGGTGWNACNTAAAPADHRRRLVQVSGGNNRSYEKPRPMPWCQCHRALAVPRYASPYGDGPINEPVVVKDPLDPMAAQSQDSSNFVECFSHPFVAITLSEPSNRPCGRSVDSISGREVRDCHNDNRFGPRKVPLGLGGTVRVSIGEPQPSVEP